MQVMTMNLPALIDDTGNGPNVPALVESWLLSKESENTRAAYLRDITQWGRWLDACGVTALAATEDHVNGWRAHLFARGLAGSTIAAKLSAVSSWSAFLVRRHVIPANPCAYVERPEVDRTVSQTPALTREQAAALMRAAEVDGRGPAGRDAALVAVIVLTGARVSEAIGADIEDLGMDRGHRTLRVTRKGGKVQGLALPPPAVAAVDAWLARRPDVEHLPARPGDVTARPRRPLFVTANGTRLRRGDVLRMLRRLARRAGLPPELVAHLGPHALRSTYATLALDAGAPLRDVQDAMGHRDPTTTRRYDKARGNLDRSPGYALAAYLAAVS